MLTPKKERRMVMSDLYSRIRHDDSEGIRFGMLFAELYYYMGKNILEAMGDEKGAKIIEKALQEFAEMRVRGMKEEAAEKGLTVKTMDDYFQIRDMPTCGWENSEERGVCLVCLFDEVWKKYGASGRKLEAFYCNIDYHLFGSFGFHLERPQCKAYGDDICRFILTRKDD